MRFFMVIFLVTVQLFLAFPVPGIDHSGFMEESYPDGPAVTKDCLSCHEEQGEQFMETAHWRWKGPAPFVSGKGSEKELGKRNLLNNY